MKILAAAFAYNEGEKIHRTLARHPQQRPYDLLVMDDGSNGVLVLRNSANQGIGAAMKRVCEYALERDYDVLVIQAGNDKDDPNEIPRLIAPILAGEADFVQGSRFLPGGGVWQHPRLSHPSDTLLPSAALLRCGGQARYRNDERLSRFSHGPSARCAHPLAAGLAQPI